MTSFFSKFFRAAFSGDLFWWVYFSFIVFIKLLALCVSFFCNVGVLSNHMLCQPSMVNNVWLGTQPLNATLVYFLFILLLFVATLAKLYLGRNFRQINNFEVALKTFCIFLVNEETFIVGGLVFFFLWAIIKITLKLFKHFRYFADVKFSITNKKKFLCVLIAFIFFEFFHWHYITIFHGLFNEQGEKSFLDCCNHTLHIGNSILPLTSEKPPLCEFAQARNKLTKCRLYNPVMQNIFSEQVNRY